MASRYWVPGTTGTWDNVAGTKWAATLGGAGGASAPTLADDVFFTSGGGTVTIAATAACRSRDDTGFAGTFSHASSITMNIGDASAGASNVVWKMASTATYVWGNATSSVVQIATTSSTLQSLTFAGKSAASITQSGLGSNVVLADAASATGTFTLTAGTFDTANFSMLWGIFNWGVAAVRRIKFGSSAITLTSTGSAFTSGSTTNITIDANTAVITLTGNMISANSVILGGLNWNGLSFVFTGGGTPQVSTGPGGIIANLTYTGTAVKTNTLGISGAVTITGTLAVASNSNINRVMVYGTTRGVAVTITAATVTLTNTVDFRDITGAGAATWTPAATGGIIGDCGGLSGITPTPGITAYLYSTASANLSASIWFAATGGTGGAVRVPLPQDNVVFDSASSPTAGRIFTFDMPRPFKDFTTSGNSNGSALAGSANFEMYGSWNNTDQTWGNSLSTVSMIFAGRGSHTINMGQNVGNTTVTVASIGGTYTLATTYTASNLATFAVTNGTFLTAGYAMSVGVFQSTGAATRAIDMTNTTIQVTTLGGNVWTMAATGLTLTTTGSTIIVTGQTGLARTFTSGSFSYNIVRYNNTDSPGPLNISGSSSYNVVDIGPGRSIIFASSGTYNVGSFPGTGQVNGYVYMPGDGLGASTPSTANLNIASNFSFRQRMTVDSYATGATMRVAGKYLAAGSQQGWRLTLASGVLSLTYSTTGADANTAVATQTLAAAGIATATPFWLRVDRDRTGGLVRFYWAPDSPTEPTIASGLWSAIGTAAAPTTNPTAAIFASSADFTVGGESGSLGTNLTGRVYRTILRNDLTETNAAVLDANFAAKAMYANSFVESSANAATITLNASSSVLYGDGRLDGRASSPGVLATINSPSGGPIATSGDWMIFKDIRMIQPLSFWIGANSILTSNTFNIYATAPGKFRHRQSAANTSATNTVSVTLPQAPTPGQLLWLNLTSSNSSTLPVLPSGFVQVNTAGPNTFGIQAFKVADGTETTLTYSQTTARTLVLEVVEYSGFTGVPTLDAGIIDGAFSSGSTTSLSTTPIPPNTPPSNTTQPSMAFGLWTSSSSLSTALSITNGFSIDFMPGNAASNAHAAVKELTSTGTVETTLTWTTSRANDQSLLSVIKDVPVSGGSSGMIQFFNPEPLPECRPRPMVNLGGQIHGSRRAQACRKWGTKMPRRSRPNREETPKSAPVEAAQGYPRPVCLAVT